MQICPEVFTPRRNLARRGRVYIIGRTVTLGWPSSARRAGTYSAGRYKTRRGRYSRCNGIPTDEIAAQSRRDASPSEAHRMAETRDDDRCVWCQGRSRNYITSCLVLLAQEINESVQDRSRREPLPRLRRPR